MYPKEQALLDICGREVGFGNQVWIYAQMTGLRDIQPRLKRLLTEAGFRDERASEVRGLGSSDVVSR